MKINNYKLSDTEIQIIEKVLLIRIEKLKSKEICKNITVDELKELRECTKCFKAIEVSKRYLER